MQSKKIWFLRIHSGSSSSIWRQWLIQGFRRRKQSFAYQVYKFTWVVWEIQAFNRNRSDVERVCNELSYRPTKYTKESTEKRKQGFSKITWQTNRNYTAK